MQKRQDFRNLKNTKNNEKDSDDCNGGCHDGSDKPGNGTSGRDTYNHQITNNIWDTSLKSIHNSYVAFNTSFSHWGESVWSSTGNKIERNIVYSENFGKDDKENTYHSNYCIGNLLEDIKTDKDVRDAAYPTAAAGYGAFAGDTPYVISGIPAGPMIGDDRSHNGRRGWHHASDLQVGITLTAKTLAREMLPP